MSFQESEKVTVSAQRAEKVIYVSTHLPMQAINLHEHVERLGRPSATPCESWAHFLRDDLKRRHHESWAHFLLTTCPHFYATTSNGASHRAGLSLSSGAELRGKLGYAARKAA